ALPRATSHPVGCLDEGQGPARRIVPGVPRGADGRRDGGERNGAVEDVHVAFPRTSHLATVADVHVMPSLMRRLERLLACGLLVAAAACESNSSPTAPSGSLQVTLGASVLKAGDTTTAVAATAGTPATGVVWSTSNGTVATVDATGTVLARRAGLVTPTASTRHA